jgi:hypothetical protein
MRLCHLVGPVTVLAAIVAAAPACADLYKWVDERGVTNYSNQPPPDAKAATKVTHVEDRVSVYSPDRALLQAVEAERQGRMRAIYEDARQDAERTGPRVAMIAAPRLPVAYDGCAGAVNCNNVYGGYYWTAPGMFFPANRRPVHLIQAVIPPGVTAGNVVGMNGYIPGNSASASSSITSGSGIYRSAPLRAGFTKR